MRGIKVCVQSEPDVCIHNISGRFSAVVDESGAVIHVSYPSEESAAVAAFKKGIAELFSTSTIDG